MPLYEYHCTSCERKFERLGSIAGRDEQVDCPRCGDQAGRRLISTFAAFSSNGGQATALGGCCGGSAGGCACRA